jgi:murein DD-endopeptidase MepM/ murein hydrolase activator NlpD
VVQQGEVIGHVGMTGNASGYHCHFEIIINGVQVNPMNYLNR